MNYREYHCSHTNADVAEEALYRSVAADNNEIDYEDTKILLGEIDPFDDRENSCDKDEQHIGM